MHHIAPQSKKIGSRGDHTELWELTKNSAGIPTEISMRSEITVQVLGDYGSGTLVLEGSNLPQPGETDWSELADSSGFPMAFSKDTPMKAMLSAPWLVRPAVKGGDENTRLRVILLIRRAN